VNLYYFFTELSTDTMPVESMPATVLISDDLKQLVQPRADLTPLTCDWAKDGLAKALDGMVGTTSGVRGYGIGSRHVQFRDAAQQAMVIDYWNQLVKLFCGVDGLPTSVTGRDTACRIIMRDV
jgi:hypothetical protein